MPHHPTHAREPSLPEILADPIVQAVMASDGVMALELKELIQSASRRLGDRNDPAIGDHVWRRRKPGHERRPGR